VAENLPPKGKVAWQVPDVEGAEIELRVVAHDLGGDRYEATAPAIVQVASRIAEIVFVEPTTSNDQFTEIRYRATEPEGLEMVELWLRAVSTPDWKMAAETRLGEPLRAQVPDGMYRVELVGVDAAGNRGRVPVGSEKGQGDLLVDTVAPLLEVDGIGDRERLFHENEWLVLRPRVQDRHLSNFPLDFRISEDGGATYRLLKEYHPNGEDYPLRLPARAGFYNIEVTARDLAGNTSREVVPVQVIPTAPAITLLTNPTGSVLVGGDEIELEWESRGLPPEYAGVTIEFSSSDEDWEVALADLPADGKAMWKLPVLDSNRCRFRLTVHRADGLRGDVETGYFTVSSTLPRVRVREIRPIREKTPVVPEETVGPPREDSGQD
jgi:hypothetical protein